MADEEQGLRAKWLAALRSGQYKQTQGRLRRDEGMCCLGVLCDIVNPKGWALIEGRWYWRNENGTEYDSYPPAPLLSLVGINYQGPIANRNDGGAGFKKHTFEQIADLIEYGKIGEKYE